MKEAYQYESVDCCNNEQPVQKSNKQPASVLIRHWETALSLILLLLGLSIDYLIQSTWFQDSIRLYWYLLAYLPVALPVWRQALIHLRKGDFFTEFFLMGIATLGAFYIGEYPEGVAVMLFIPSVKLFNKALCKKHGRISKHCWMYGPNQPMLFVMTHQKPSIQQKSVSVKSFE